MDYRHRPAKNIERHLIVEACRRVLSAYSPLRKKFQYIGFGALEFLDFQLVHRALGIERMISIEKQHSERHEFNKPFKSIKIVQGHSNDVLKGSELDLSRPTIIWLDYMGSLDQSVISDLLQVARSVAAPSFVVVTLNAVPTAPIKDRLTKFQAAVGKEYVPPTTSNDTLAKLGTALTQRIVLDEIMQEGIKQRKDEVSWMQSMNFQYSDGALMQTIAGLVVPKSVSRVDVDQMFADLDFYRPGDEYVDIRVPVITAKERLLLDRQLPKMTKSPLSSKSIPERDLVAYRNVYRYLHLAGLQSAVETTWTA